MTTTPPPPEVFCPGAPRGGPKFDPPHHYNVHTGRGRANGAGGTANRKRADRTPSPARADTSFASIDSEAPNELKHTPKPKRMRTPDYCAAPTSHFIGSFPDEPFPSTLMPHPKNSTMAHNPHSAAKLEMHAESDDLIAHAQASHSILPTPTKTPRKQVMHPESAEAVRTLFPKEKAAMADTATPSKPDLSGLPTPVSKKRGKRMRKTVGFSLDDEEGAADIEIYTDSKEMIPEIDDSPNNPFYVRPGETKTYRKLDISPGESNRIRVGIELMKRNCGYMAVDPRQGRRYVFPRGDFDDMPSSPLLATEEQKQAYAELQNLLSDDEIPELDAELAARPSASDLKPRRLFAEELDELGTSSRAIVVGDDDDSNLGRDTNVAAPTAKHKRVHKLLIDGHHDDESSSATTPSTNQGSSLESASSSPSTGTARKPIDLTRSPFDAWPRRKGSKTRASGANVKNAAVSTPVHQAVTEPSNTESVTAAATQDDAASEDSELAAPSSFTSLAGTATKREGTPLGSGTSKRARGN